MLLNRQNHSSFIKCLLRRVNRNPSGFQQNIWTRTPPVGTPGDTLPLTRYLLQTRETPAQAAAAQQASAAISSSAAQWKCSDHSLAEKIAQQREHLWPQPVQTQANILTCEVLQDQRVWRQKRFHKFVARWDLVPPMPYSLCDNTSCLSKNCNNLLEWTMWRIRSLLCPACTRYSSINKDKGLRNARPDRRTRDGLVSLKPSLAKNKTSQLFFPPMASKNQEKQ